MYRVDRHEKSLYSQMDKMHRNWYLKGSAHSHNSGKKLEYYIVSKD